MLLERKQDAAATSPAHRERQLPSAKHCKPSINTARQFDAAQTQTKRNDTREHFYLGPVPS